MSWTIYTLEAKVVARGVSKILLENATPGRYIPEFDGVYIPSMPLFSYLERLIHYMNLWHLDEMSGTVTALAAMEYIRRFGEYSLYGIHRIVATAFFVASKFLEYEVMEAKYWASVAGVPPEDLMRMEVTFTFRLKWNLRVTARDFRELEDLVEQSGGIPQGQGDVPLRDSGLLPKVQKMVES